MGALSRQLGSYIAHCNGPPPSQYPSPSSSRRLKAADRDPATRHTACLTSAPARSGQLRCGVGPLPGCHLDGIEIASPMLEIRQIGEISVNFRLGKEGLQRNVRLDCLAEAQGEPPRACFRFAFQRLHQVWHADACVRRKRRSRAVRRWCSHQLRGSPMMRAMKELMISRQQTGRAFRRGRRSCRPIRLIGCLPKQMHMQTPRQSSPLVCNNLSSSKLCLRPRLTGLGRVCLQHVAWRHRRSSQRPSADPRRQIVLVGCSSQQSFSNHSHRLSPTWRRRAISSGRTACTSLSTAFAPGPVIVGGDGGGEAIDPDGTVTSRSSTLSRGRSASMGASAGASLGAGGDLLAERIERLFVGFPTRACAEPHKPKASSSLAALCPSSSQGTEAARKSLSRPAMAPRTTGVRRPCDNVER